MKRKWLAVALTAWCLGGDSRIQADQSQIHLREEFDGKYHLPWEVRNPDANRTSLENSPGCLTLTSQPGSIYRANSPGIRNLFLTANPAARGGDLVCTIHIKDFKPTQKYHQTGIILYHDDDNYLKCTAEFNEKNDEFHRVGLLAETDADVKSDIEDRQSLSTGKPFWLRIIKQGRSYTSQFSHDGDNFETTAGCEWGDGSPPWIGFMAKNVSARAEVDVQIESFEIQNADLDPEIAQHTSFLREEFDNGYALRWKVIEPDASHVSLRSNPGNLTLTTQKGTMYAQDSVPVKNIFLTANPLAVGADLECTIRVNAFEPSQSRQQIGVLLYQDADNYVKVAAEKDAKADKHSVSLVAEENARARRHLGEFEMKTPFWVRVSKVGRLCSAEFSLDGKQFKSIGKATWNVTTPPLLGFVGTSANAGDEVDVVVDAFEVKAARKSK